MVTGNEVVHVSRGVLVELLVVAEDEDCDVDRAENRELVGLFEQTAFALQKCTIGEACWLEKRVLGGRLVADASVENIH